MKLDSPIADPRFFSARALNNIKTDVGIEVELEGSVAPFDEFGDPVFWKSKTDTSLRDGFEFILGQPVSLKNLPAALDEFDRYISKMKPKSSIRTSTHIHVNVLGNTIQEVYQAALGYYLVEELLVQAQPKERVGNLFCLRMSDSRAVAFYLERSLTEGNYFHAFNEERFKYSALNLCTVNRFGSLEFRIFPAMWTKAELLQWSMVCTELIRNASKMPIKSLLDAYDDMSVKDFLAMLMPSGKWLWKNKTDDYLNSCLRTNYDQLRDLQDKLVEPKLVLPQEYWTGDDGSAFEATTPQPSLDETATEWMPTTFAVTPDWSFDDSEPVIDEVE